MLLCYEIIFFVYVFIVIIVIFENLYITGSVAT